MSWGPYRYQCVECGSTSVQVKGRAAETNPSHRPDGLDDGEPWWYCSSCGSGGQARAEDRETGKLVKASEREKPRSEQAIERERRRGG